MNKTISAREAAFLSLRKIISDERYSNLEIDATIKKYGLEGVEKSLYARLVYGTVEHLVTIDYIIASFAKISVDRLEEAVANVLRLGVYQLFYLDKIPDSAACNESVILIKKYSHRGADGFVNGVLRNIARNRDSIVFPDRNDKRYLSIRYSVPRLVTKLLEDQYGFETAEKILSALSVQPKLTVRVNTLVTDIESVAAKYECAKTEAPFGLILNNPQQKIEIGEYYVQDESSQLCTEAVGAKSGETVIDVCSCPGGKSFGMAMDMNNIGKIYSLDLHASKLSLVRNGASLLGIGIIETAECDGTVGDANLDGKADRVLCDVPCSGLGVISKKPELRFVPCESIMALPETQFAILNRSSKYLKKGGRIVYSTCTLNKNENRAVVDRFLHSNGNFELICDRTVLPNENRDGFYYAVMEKREK